MAAGRKPDPRIPDLATADGREQFRSLLVRHGDVRAVAKHLGVPESNVWYYLRQANLEVYTVTLTDIREKPERKEEGEAT